MLWYLAIFLLKHEALVFVFGEKMFVENVHVCGRFFIRIKSNHKLLWLLVFWVVQVAHVVVVVKCNIERCDVGTGVDPVSLSQANPNPMREGKPQDLSAAENWKLHKVYVNLAPIWRYYFTSFGHCMCATLLQDSLKNFLLELIIAMWQYHPLWIAFTDIMMFWFL